MSCGRFFIYKFALEKMRNNMCRDLNARMRTGKLEHRALNHVHLGRAKLSHVSGVLWTRALHHILRKNGHAFWYRRRVCTRHWSILFQSFANAEQLFSKFLVWRWPIRDVIWRANSAAMHWKKNSCLFRIITALGSKEKIIYFIT